MFTLYAQSSSSNNVSSTVKQCESIQIGKNIAKTYITNYVKQVYLENICLKTQLIYQKLW